MINETRMHEYENTQPVSLSATTPPPTQCRSPALSMPKSSVSFRQLLSASVSLRRLLSVSADSVSFVSSIGAALCAFSVRKSLADAASREALKPVYNRGPAVPRPRVLVRQSAWQQRETGTFLQSSSRPLTSGEWDSNHDCASSASHHGDMVA